jgi:PAS domain S-box-containing protein
MSTDEILDGGRRLEALPPYDRLDRLPEQALNRAAELAAHLVDAPIAAASVLGGEARWVATRGAVDPPDLHDDQTFVRRTVQAEELLVVNDVAQAPRLSGHPWGSGDAGLRFYAGVPLVLPGGSPFGGLYVLDVEPRAPSAETLAQLETLADMVTDAFDAPPAASDAPQSSVMGPRQQQWKQLAEAHRDPILISVEGAIRYINPAGAELVGADAADDLVGASIYQFVPSDAQRQRLEARAEQLRQGTPTSPVEHDIVRLDGERRTIQVYSVPIEYEGERAAQTMVRDVTEQRRTQAALRESKVALEQAQSIAKMGNGRWDLGTDRVQLSREAERLLGLPPAPVHAPVAFLAVVHPDDRSLIQEEVRQLRQGYAHDAEYRVIPRGHDTVRWLQSRARPETNDEGEITRVVGTIVDITERKRIEQAFVESEERFQALLRSLDDVVWTADIHPDTLNQQLRYINDAAESVYGYPTEAFINDPTLWIETIHPDDRDWVTSRKARLTDTRTIRDEYRIVQPDGEVRWIRSSVHVIRRNDEVLRVGGIDADITEQKQTEQALRRSEERWRRLVESHRDPIQITVDGIIEYTNPAGAQLLGAESPDAVTGRSILEFVPSEAVKEQLRARVEQVERREPTDPYEHEIERLDGEGRIVESYAIPIEYDGKRAAQTVIRDITARKKAENELKREREFLQKLFDTIPVMIMVYDPEQAQFDVNEEFERVLGWSAESANATDLMKACFPDPDDREAAVAFLRDPGSGWTDFTLTTREGDEVICSWSNIRLSDDTLVGIGIDLTERKQLEAQLRQAQKMETVGTLAGGIAHDFNNILHAAIVYLQMSLEDVPDGSPTSEFLTHAEQGLQRASELVDKLLTFSRQEGMATEESLDLAAVVRETIGLVEPSLPDDVSLRTQFNDACSVLGDRGQLQQVVMNLMTNAVQAMEDAAAEGDLPVRDAGVLDVDVRTANIDADLADRHLHLDPGHYVRLSISDTGPGMAPSTKERIFEPFFTTKEVGKGTGLGLSVVHGIVRAHNGEITVFSEPGEGTTFNVYLPCTDALSDAEQAAMEPSTDTDTSRGHVLLVEDDEQVTELEAIRLRRLGYEVTTRANGEAALQALTTDAATFDVVLTDYAMPAMNGLELARELRRQAVPTPIILMSGFSAQVSEADVREAGVATFLRKPVSSRVLRDALRQALDDAG